MNLTPEDVQDILSLLDALPVDEFDLRTERFRLTLRRAADGQWARSGTEPEGGAPERGALEGGAPEGSAREPRPAGEGTLARARTVPGQSAPDAGADGLGEVRSPLPGTFYRAPKPGAPPFVEVGSRVGADTVVGIIETMKMFNPVPAGLAGRVAAIELADAEFAEQDAVLMRIAPGDQ